MTQEISKFKVGDSAELKHLVTREDVTGFVRLTGDDNKLHVDEAYAAKTAMKQPVVHGMLSASFISTVIGTKLPGDGALWFAQSFEFLLPVRVGDELTIRAEVIAVQERQQTLELRTDIFNQHKQKVTTGVAKVRMMSEEPAAKQPASDLAARLTALVIGGSGGIGRETCLELAAKGFAVCVHYHRNKAKAEELVSKITASGGIAFAVGGDITDEAQVKEIVEHAKRRLGTIGALISCASGTFAFTKLADTSWADMEKQLDMSVRANFFLAKAVIPAMQEAKYGRIVFLTTLAAEGTPPTELCGYVTGKCALQGMARSMAAELAPLGICVNLVSPGMTDTDLIAGVPEKVRLVTAARSPMRRLAQPGDIAPVIAMLSSPAAGYIAGETIRINGGQQML